MQEKGRLPEQKPAVTGSGLSLFGQAAGATVEEALNNFIDQARPGDYIALLAYLEENPQTNDALEKIRLNLRDRTHLATTAGYGPRYLHSTGQIHKGGPNTGLFIELTQDEPDTVQIPGQRYSFGRFNLAQAQGDFEVLQKHGRRVIRIHLGDSVKEGLAQVNRAFAGRP
ncbi:MAG: hypothetical protein GX491_01415 [Chloroflexi bacterium]|nr:hypothetical protein [Chloroflexota bacterium]